VDYTCLNVRSADGVGWIEYHRPPRNGFDWRMLREVPSALDELIGADGVRVVVIASMLERWFSAGADLAVFRDMTQDEVREWVTICHGIVERMRASPKPLLAAIHGTAVGGGLEITLHCDVRFAAEDAQLGQPEVNIAFIPPIGATQALARLLGRSRALRVLYEGTLMSAREALAIGLVDVVVPPAQLRAAVADYAAMLIGKPAATLAAIRRCVTEGGAVPMEAGLAIELEEAVRLGGHGNFAEGVDAFLAKRAPRWR